MKKIRCILFDCDGVLVDSETIGIRVLISMARDYGFEMDLTDAVELMRGLSFKACCDLVENATQRKLVDGFEQEFRKKSFDAFKEEMKPMPGVVSFVNSLKIPMGVASSGPVSKIRLNLGLVGLLEKFEATIFSCFEINSWKPAPDIYLHAAASMGFAVEECIVIEDSVPGVQAGVSGGFEVYGYAHTKTAEGLSAAGALLFNDFEELAQRLANRLA